MTDVVYAKNGIDPYPTCEGCVVKDWCGRRNGKVALPRNYALDPECGGFVMLEQALALSGIPKEYRNANLNTFVVDADNQAHSNTLIATMQYPVELVESGQNIAFLHHGKGTGKTFTACAIANEYIYKACMSPAFDFESPLVRYVKFGDWSNEIRRAHQVGGSDLFEKMYNNIEQMKTVPLLILDDIGSGRITDIIRDLTYDVIDKRKEEQKSTIYTSNLVDATLRGDDYLRDVVVSRMLFNTRVVMLGGRDRRQD